MYQLRSRKQSGPIEKNIAGMSNRGNQILLAVRAPISPRRTAWVEAFTLSNGNPQHLT